MSFRLSVHCLSTISGGFLVPFLSLVFNLFALFSIGIIWFLIILKHRSIKVHLSAVRHLQIEGNYLDPFGGVAMPKLEYVLRGIRKHKVEKGAGQQPCLPITPDILARTKSQWEPTAHT